ncbi:MAG TPA: gluconokinase, GntK/IdnK-type [Pseudonocardia sp.]|jgi:gluconokinase
MVVVVVMGVSGSGKSTVGAALAGRLGVGFADGDAFHPPANVAKMTEGQPLSDDDRLPWLDALAGWVGGHSDTGGVLAASALKRRYRDRLRAGGRVWFLELTGDREVLAERLRRRTGHFMSVRLLDSQLADLEPLQPDEPGRAVALDRPVGDLVEDAVEALRAGGAGAG